MKKIYYLLTAILSILMGIIYAETPLCVDDLVYLQNSTGDPGSWEYFYTTLQNCIDRWNYDTGRLCNTLSAPFLALFPHWVYALISAVLIFLIYIYGIKILRCDWVSIESFLWIMIVSFALPWFDFMFTLIFSINYVWGAALGLLTLFFFLHQDRKNISNIQYILLFLLSFLTGWWHEGLSVPLMCFFSMFLVVDWRQQVRSRYVILVGLGTGIGMILLLPAIWKMVGFRESSIFRSTLWETLMQIIALNCMFYIYMALLLVTVCFKKLRHRVFQSKHRLALILGFLAFGIPSTILYIKYFSGPRIGFFPQIFCGIGVLYLIKFLNIKWKRKTSYIAIIVAAFLSCVNLFATIHEQAIITSEFYQVKQLEEKSKRKKRSGYVFFNQTPVSIGISLLKPTYLLLNNEYGLNGTKLFPAELEDYSFSQKQLICKSDPRFRIYHNKLLYKGKISEKRLYMYIKDDKGREIRTRGLFRIFPTTDGDSIYYVLPHAQTLNKTLVMTDARFVD